MSSTSGMPNSIGQESNVSGLRRAAQYVRMSTDHQEYSIQGQKEAIAEYALNHDIQIVRTYADEHKSGLTMKRRPALKRLISDVQEGRADFEIIAFDAERIQTEAL